MTIVDLEMQQYVLF